MTTLPTATNAIARAAVPRVLADDLLTEEEAAAELRVTMHCLRRRRQRRQTPTYIKVGRLVRYRRSDLEAFKRDRMVYPDQED